MELSIIKQDSLWVMGAIIKTFLSSYLPTVLVHLRWVRGDSRFGSDLQAPYTLCFMVASLQKLLPLLMKPRTEMSLYVYDYLVVLCFYLIHKSFFFSWIIHTHTNTHTRYTQAPFPCRKFKIHSLIAPSPQTQEPIFYFSMCLLIYPSKDSPTRCFSQRLLSQFWSLPQICPF